MRATIFLDTKHDAILKTEVIKFKIIGIDASLTGTGIAIVDNGCSTIMTIKSKLKGTSRLIEIRDNVAKLIKGANLVAIEEYAYAKANQAHQIGELGGVLRVLFSEMGLNWIEVNPSLVKKYATGKGNATKEAIAVGIYKRWSHQFSTNDEADAFILAIIGSVIAGCNCEELTVFQREVVERLKTGKNVVKKKFKKEG